MNRASYGYTDLSGLRFGRLTVLNNGKVINKNRKVPVKCDCGSEKEVFFQSLVKGTTSSCGCIASEKSSYRATILDIRISLPHGEAARNSLLSQYKSVAKTRNFSWNISDELFFNLTKSNCYYCGVEPFSEKKTGYKTGSYIYNGVDRLNNLLGYEIDNVVSCCKHCNIAKNNMSLSEFKEWIIRLTGKVASWDF